MIAYDVAPVKLKTAARRSRNEAGHDAKITRDHPFGARLEPKHAGIRRVLEGYDSVFPPYEDRSVRITGGLWRHKRHEHSDQLRDSHSSDAPQLLLADLAVLVGREVTLRDDVQAA